MVNKNCLAGQYSAYDHAGVAVMPSIYAATSSTLCAFTIPRLGLGLLLLRIRIRSRVVDFLRRTVVDTVCVIYTV